MNRMRSRDSGTSEVNQSRILWVLKALLLSYLVTAILLFVLAGLLYKLELDERAVSAGIVAIYIMATLIGGIALGKMAKVKRFLWGFCLGFVYFAFLLLITLGVYRSIDITGMKMLSTFVLCAGGGMIGGMIS